MAKITIYHNPKCSTSRNALEMIRAAGHEPEIVDYLKTGWTLPQLKTILQSLGEPAYAILRTKEKLADELGLTDKTPEAKILAAMIENPVLVERPIVTTPKTAIVCRPLEKLQSLIQKLRR